MFFSDFTIFNNGAGVRRRPSTGTLGAFSLLALVGAVREHMRCQDDYRALMQLPDYLLDDIGVDREQVSKAARRSAF